MAKNNVLVIKWTGNAIRVASGVASQTELKIHDLGVCEFRSKNDEQISAWLKETVGKPHKYEQVQCVLSRRCVILRTLELPAVKREEIERMVHLQIEQHVPYTLDEMVYDVVNYEGIQQGYSSVLVAVVSRKEVDRIQSICKEAGLLLDGITVNTWGIVATFTRKALLTIGTNEYVLIADASHEETEILIMHGSRVRTSRSFIHPPEQSKTDKNSYIQRLLSEIQHTVSVVQFKKDSEIQVWLGPSLQNVGTEIQEALENASMGLSIRIPIQALGDMPEVDASEIGMRGAVLINTIPHANLLSQEIKAVRSQEQLRGYRVFAITFVIVTLLIVATAACILYVRKNSYLMALEQELRMIDPQAKRLSVVTNKYRAVNRVRRQQVVPLITISDLYATMPRTMYITEFSYKASQGLELRGYADSVSTVSDALVLLQKKDLYKNAEIRFAKQKELQGREVVDFEISCPFSLLEE